MSTLNKRTTFGARATYVVKASKISEVLCHRYQKDTEEFLIRWKSEPDRASSPPEAIYSWHPLNELTRCLNLVQNYLETRKQLQKLQSKSKHAFVLPVNRKRKAFEEHEQSSRDRPNGLITPSTVSRGTRSPSVISISSSSDAVQSKSTDDRVYNGVLERKEGWIIAKPVKGSRDTKNDAGKLPTAAMVEAAASSPVDQAERAIRQAFHRKLNSLPKLSLENKIDISTPSLEFTFVSEYVLGDGVYRADPETIQGCDKPCRPNMGAHCGCEYPRLCVCLEYAAVNENALRQDSPNNYHEYLRKKNAGEFPDTEGLPKRFPYQKSNDPDVPQTLVQFYRDERHPIYECNPRCKCGPVCKSRVVQKGRKVPLTIFKTRNRGWGVKCGEDLIQGEFIDTYLGEVITNEEADRREQIVGKDKASYLYSLDKHVGDDETLTAENCLVVDGQFMGGPTRFINHCCEPNCRQYTVSYNKHDQRIYDLAFFAYEDIKAGTELTFDYMDKDEEEEEEVVRKREEDARDPDNLDMKPCNCGARKCRGYLWV